MGLNNEEGDVRPVDNSDNIVDYIFSIRHFIKMYLALMILYCKILQDIPLRCQLNNDVIIFVKGLSVHIQF